MPNITPIAITGTVTSTPSGVQTVIESTYTRADTYTTTGNGTTITCTAGAPNSFGILVKGTGAGATSWDVRLEGSLDGTNFSQILQHTNTTGDGVNLWSGSSLSPSLYFRSRCAAVSLGSATNIVVTIIGL